MQRKRDHGAQRTWVDERTRPLHQSGRSGAARPQRVGEGGHPMTRRAFITLLGGAAAAWPLAARAQQAKLPTIGFFSVGSAGALSHWVAVFVQRLREIATEFVRLKVDIIVTHSAAPVIAAKQATAVIPIVFALAADPLRTGLVASLARPDGNVTGLSTQTTDLARKRLEVFRELVPGLRRLAIMANVDAPGAVLEMA